MATCKVSRLDLLSITQLLAQSQAQLPQGGGSQGQLGGQPAGSAVWQAVSSCRDNALVSQTSHMQPERLHGGLALGCLGRLWGLCVLFLWEDSLWVAREALLGLCILYLALWPDLGSLGPLGYLGRIWVGDQTNGERPEQHGSPVPDCKGFGLWSHLTSSL